LRRAARERVGEEIDKLLAAPDPVRGLELLRELDLLGSVLPELVPLATCVAGADRPDVWRHTLDALALAARPGRIPGASAARRPDGARVVRWALLLHDVAKPDTLDWRPDGRPTFHGHEVVGARRADRLMRRLCVGSGVRDRVVRLIRLHLRPSLLAEAGGSERGLGRLVREAGDDVPLLAVHAACDALASGSPDARPRFRRLARVLRRLIARHAELERSPLPRLVDGRDLMHHLGIDPGPRVGDLLERVRQAQQDGDVRTRDEALALASSLVAGGEGDDGRAPRST
jgi:poly(A) polymerase